MSKICRRHLLARFHFFRCAILIICLSGLTTFAASPSITLSCSSDNDLFIVLKNNGLKPKCFATPSRAVNAAAKDSAVLLLADDYPEKPLTLSSEIFQTAAENN